MVNACKNFSVKHATNFKKVNKYSVMIIRYNTVDELEKKVKQSFNLACFMFTFLCEMLFVCSLGWCRQYEYKR